jgi:ArsR family metal-binding transcriptional regulator
MWEMLWKWIKANPDLTAYITTAIGTIFGGVAHIYSRMLHHSREIKALWKKHREDIISIHEKHTETTKIIHEEILELKEGATRIDDLMSRKFDSLMHEVTLQGKTLARIEGYIDSQKN